MNRFPELFQTGLLGAAEALSLERRYNPPTDHEVELSPVTCMAGQISDVNTKINMINHNQVMFMPSFEERTVFFLLQLVIED